MLAIRTRSLHLALALALAPSSAAPLFAAKAGGEVAPELVGMSPARLALVDSLIRAGIREGVTPGAALAIGRRGSLVRLRGYGAIDWHAGSAPVTDSTLYDIASLTKVVGTTFAAMLLIERGELHLDLPLFRYTRFWPIEGARSEVTVRHLLTHTSGLPAGIPIERVSGGRAERLRRAAAAGLVARPGTRTIYSDLSMVVLGSVIEQVTGDRLDAFLEREVFAPLGLRETCFNPLGRAEPFALSRIAPTEHDRTVRKRHLHGEVHDPLAAALGGVAGNAGIFSSARDLAVFAQLMLDRSEGRTGGVVRAATVRSFTHSWNGGRALGWDVPWSPASGAGDYFSDRAYGHTGFTGTSIWIDPERELFVVLLTNRVNPSAANRKHIPWRKAIHDAVNLAIVDQEVGPRLRIAS